MCGIIGLVDPGRRYPVRFGLLRDTMMARGPDGWGEFTEDGLQMAMRRLAIIDLARGDQPFYARNGGVVAFQNGEIYNYRALKSELEAAGAAFVSDSDTEILAHGYAEWGMEGLLRRLDGMYALAIYDRDAAVLHLARDRFGEKPLFISRGPDCFAYASSLIPLAALPWVDLGIDDDALDRYLALHYVPGEATLLKGVRRLLPGERLELHLRDMTLLRHRYFVPELGACRPVALEEAAAEVERAVASRLVADVPVGVFLSGGVDSSLVAAIAAKHSPGIRTFSIGFTEDAYDESAHARRVADHIGSTHSAFRFDLGSFKALLPEVANALDEPVGDQAMLPVYWLSRDAGASVKVVLSGEGGDELFAGYDYYGAFSAANGDGGARPQEHFIDDAHQVTPSGFPLISDAALRRRLTGREAPAPVPWEQDLMAQLAAAAAPLERARAADLHSWLPSDLLVKLDRMTMAHSLEGRAPYLKPELVQMALSSPEELLLAPGRNKILLRAVAEPWLPRDIVYRPKQGFVLPMRGWLRDWIEGNGGPHAYFADFEAVGLDPEQTSTFVAEDLRTGASRERLLFALVLLKEWHRSALGKIRSLRRWIGRDCRPPLGKIDVSSKSVKAGRSQSVRAAMCEASANGFPRDEIADCDPIETDLRRRGDLHDVPTLAKEHFENCRLFADRRALLEIVPKCGIGAEVGVYKGDFSKILVADLLPRKLVLIDLKFSADVTGMFSKLIGEGVVEVIESDSSIALENFPDGYFDWIYIDGDHSPEGVRKDAGAGKRKIKENGILVFNDYKMGDHNYPSGFYVYGVIDAVNNLCLQDGFELIGFAFHPQMYCDAAIRRRK